MVNIQVMLSRLGFATTLTHLPRPLAGGFGCDAVFAWILSVAFYLGIINNSITCSKIVEGYLAFVACIALFY
jgi:hypothetical protein